LFDFYFSAILLLMRVLTRVFLIVVFILTVIAVLPSQTQAQLHNCGSCCDGSTRYCTYYCSSGCTNNPDATPTTPSSASYAGNGTAYQVVLSWTANKCNETNTLVVDDLLTATNPDITQSIHSNIGVTGTGVQTYILSATAAHSYNWYVTGTNNCSTTTAGLNGPVIGVPSLESVTLAYSETQACTNHSCDSGDIIIDLDTNNNKIIPIQAVFYDPNTPTGSNYTDIQNGWIILDNNIDYADGYYYRIRYTDNGDGTYSVIEDPTNAGTLAGSLSISATSRSRSADNKYLYVNFSLNVSALPAGSDFLSNIYLNALDFTSIQTGRGLMVGTGDFQPLDDACVGNSGQAIDIWNGNDVTVTSTITKTGSPTPTVASLVTLYNALSRTSPGSYHIPYNTNLTITSSTIGYYVSGANFANFGGSYGSDSDGDSDRTLYEGGIRQVINPTGRWFPVCIIDKTISINYEEDVPTLGTLTLGGGVDDNSCTGVACNNDDIIVDRDLNRNRLVNGTFTVTDDETNILRKGNPAQAYKKSDLNQIIVRVRNAGGTAVAVCTYTDNPSTADTPAFVTSGTLSGLFNSCSYVIPQSGGLPSGDVTTVNFILDMSAIPRGGEFLGSITAQAIDFAGESTGEVTLASNIDFWNGKDVTIIGNFYEVDSPSDICVANKSALTTLPNYNITTVYNPTSVEWDNPVTTWKGSSTFQPYNYFNSSNYRVNYRMADTTSDHFIISMDTQRYGGSCYDAAGEVIQGEIQNAIYRNGGVNPANSSYSEAAFGLKEIGNVWSEVVDGHLFLNNDLEINIESTTCTGCYFSSVIDSITNGVPVVNGSITAYDSNVYGSPSNWYSQAASNPFSVFVLPSYSDVLAKYNDSGTYTEVSAATNISAIASTAVNHTYFIDNNFTVNANFDLESDEYAVFVVSGNMTVNASVTRLDGLFLVLGNVTILDDGVANYDGSDISDQLEIHGALAVGGYVNIERTLGAANNFAPPVRFIYEPTIIAALEAANVGVVDVQKLWLGEY
jgi:hypothetical protein